MTSSRDTLGRSKEMLIPKVTPLTGADVINLLNKMNATAQKTQLGSLLSGIPVKLVATYDFAVSGGAISTIHLKDANGDTLSIPTNAVVLSAHVDVVTAPTSAGSATIALKIQSAGDLKAATAFDNAYFGTGLHATTLDGAAANMIKTTAARNVDIVIAAAALTAGKINVIVEYIVSA